MYKSVFLKEDIEKFIPMNWLQTASSSSSKKEGAYLYNRNQPEINHVRRMAELAVVVLD